MATLKIKKDTTWNTPGRITNFDGSNMDLVDIATITLLFDGKSIELTKVDSTQGLVSIPWESGDLDTVGIYPAEFVFVDVNGELLPSKTFNIEVTDRANVGAP
jgi:hypothetical protein